MEKKETEVASVLVFLVVVGVAVAEGVPQQLAKK